MMGKGCSPNALIAALAFAAAGRISGSGSPSIVLSGSRGRAIGQSSRRARAAISARDGRDGGGGDAAGVHQLAVPLRAKGRLQAAIPWVAFPGLGPFRGALLFLVLGGGRGGHPGAGAQHPAARGQIAAAESPPRLTVVAGVFERFGGQAIPLLAARQPHQALQSDGQANTFARRIKRLEDGQGARPGDDFFQARAESLTAGDFLFSSELALRKTRLVDPALEVRKQGSGRL